MASMNSLWWMTPLQAVVALSAAWNSGASGQPSLLTWPIIELNTVPAIHSGRQARLLLEKSEFIYPRVNAAGTITNLTLTIMAYLHRDTHMNASAKWPVLLMALACNVATTAWALTVMVPINDNIRKSSNKLEHSKDDSVAERHFRQAVVTWKKYAIVREVLMMAAAALGVYATFLDGVYALPMREI